MKISKVFVASIDVVLLINTLFWILVSLNANPWYREGCIVKIGPLAMVFAHGSWNATPSLVEHMTTLNNETRPTLEVVQKLHEEGAEYIWGTWCYPNDYDGVIRIDRVSNSKVYWPSYVSYGGKGKTIPIWIGPWFIRVNDNKMQGVDTTSFDFSKPLRMSIITPDESYWWYSEKTVYSIGYEDKAYILNDINNAYGFQPDSIHLDQNSYPLLRITREEAVMIRNHEKRQEDKSTLLTGKCWIKGKELEFIGRVLPLWPPLPGHGM